MSTQELDLTGTGWTEEAALEMKAEVDREVAAEPDPDQRAFNRIPGEGEGFEVVES